MLLYVEVLRPVSPLRISTAVWLSARNEVYLFLDLNLDHNVSQRLVDVTH